MKAGSRSRTGEPGEGTMNYRHAMTALLVSGTAALIAAPAGADMLSQLVAGAKTESALRVTLHPTITPDTAKKVAAAFNRAYGLSIDVKPDLTGRYSGKAAKGAIEYKTGGKPSYDVMVLNESAFMTLAAADALVRIEGWREMLPEGTDAAKASPGPIAGIGFKCCDLYWGFSYNPEKFDSARLPLAMKDLGGAGKAAITLFASNITAAILKYDAATLVGYAKGWGAAKVKRLHPTAMAQRVALGEFALGGFQSTEQFLDARQKGATLSIAMFSDFVPHGVLLHAVRKGTASPNAAKLFALWTTGRDAVGVMSEGNNLGNADYGGNEAIEIARREAEKVGVTPASFFDSAENYAKLQWLASKPGKKFTGQLVRAIKGSKKK